MARTTALLTALILGFVVGTYQLNQAFPKNGYNYWTWTPMGQSDIQYVCSVLAMKFADNPQCGHVWHGNKQQLSDGVKFIFLYDTPIGNKCCGRLDDEYQVTFHWDCNPDASSNCNPDLFLRLKKRQ